MGHALGPEQVCWTPLPERLRTGNYWGLCGVRWQSEPRVRQFKPLHSRRGSHRNITGRMEVKVDAESPGGPKRPQTRPETLGTGVAWCLRDPVTPQLPRCACSSGTTDIRCMPVPVCVANTILQRAQTGPSAYLKRLVGNASTVHVYSRRLCGTDIEPKAGPIR